MSDPSPRRQSVETAIALVTAWLSEDAELITTLMREVLADRDATERLALSSVWLSGILLCTVTSAESPAARKNVRAAALRRLQRTSPLILASIAEGDHDA